MLLLGAAYCLVPVLWVVIAATKSTGELFESFTLPPGTHLPANIAGLGTYRGGPYWRWMAKHRAVRRRRRGRLHPGLGHGRVRAGEVHVPRQVPDLPLDAGRRAGAQQFVAIWNNYVLPFVMLGDDRLFPLTVGLSGLLDQSATQPAMYTAVALQRYWRVDHGAGAVQA